MNHRLALVFLSLLFPAVVGAQSIAGKPFLSVQGHAETLVVPDVFPVKVSLKEISTTPAKSQALIEGLARVILASAAKLKVADADIDVGNLSVSPETKWDDDKEIDIFLGNSYERELTIRFRSLEDLKTFIADLPDSKNIRIDTQTFEVSNAAEIKRKLRRAAIEDAKKAAAEMADAVGKRLVDLQNVSDRAQTTAYSTSGYDNGQLDYMRVGGTALLAPGTVRSRGIVLREGVIKISADAFLIYVMGD